MVRSAIADRLVVAVAVSGLRERLARTPATEANVQARVGAFGGTDEARVDARVRRLVREAFGKTDVSIHASAESGSFSAAGRTVVFGFFEELPQHARLHAGRWPAAGGPVVDVVAPEGVARELGLGVGDRIEARSRLDPGHVVVARLVGIFAPERPSSAYWWGSPAATGARCSGLSEDEPVEYRRTAVGFVFQSFGLIPILTAAENVEVPLRLRRCDPDERDARVLELLALVDLSGRAGHRPQELSGGEQQRVAIARALANEPRLLIADEPTGRLDSQRARTVMGLLRRLVDERGVSVVVATHDPLLIGMGDRIVELRDGAVASGGNVAAAAPSGPRPEDATRRSR